MNISLENDVEREFRAHARRLLHIARCIGIPDVCTQQIVSDALPRLYERSNFVNADDRRRTLLRSILVQALTAARPPHQSNGNGGVISDPSPKQIRAVIVLRELENLPYCEIAELLKCGVADVIDALHRGRRQLSAMFIAPSC